MQVVTFPPRRQPSMGHRTFDEISGRVELRIARGVAFADVARERLHIRDKFRPQCDLGVIESGGSRDVASRHSHSESPSEEDDDKKSERNSAETGNHAPENRGRDHLVNDNALSASDETESNCVLRGLESKVVLCSQCVCRCLYPFWKTSPRQR